MSKEEYICHLRNGKECLSERLTRLVWTYINNDENFKNVCSEVLSDKNYIAAVDAGRTEDEYLRGCVPLISGIIELTLKANPLHPLSCDVVNEVLASIDFVKLERDFIEAEYGAEKEW